MNFNHAISEASKRYLGIEEWPGAKSNPVVEEFFARAGFNGMTDDDSDKVVTNLTPLVIEAMPYAQLGPAVYEVRVVVPRQIAVGPAVYKAVEVPSCTWVQKIWPPEVPYPLVEFHVTPIKDPRA